MSTAQILRQFDKLGREADVADAARRAAIERFGQLGLPGRRSESWRYTDLSQITEKDLCFIAPAPNENALQRSLSLIDDLGLAADRPRCVFVDGHWIQSLSRILDESCLKISSKSPYASDLKSESALSALNAAFAIDDVAIHVTGKTRAPLEILFVGTGNRLAPQVRLKLELAADAEATVIQRFVDLPEASESWLNLVTDVDLKEGSELNLYRLQRHSSDHYQTTLNRVMLAAGATLNAGSVDLGGAVVRNEFDIALNGNEAQASVFGITLTSGRQHSDTRIAVDHRAPHTTSRQDFRAIADDSSRSVFNGKVSVQEHAQHINAQQRNDNLLLSAKAEVDTKPELEIYADQVVCSHGATVGELSDDHLFYLRARGIDERAAKGILTTAFANTILERFEIEDFQVHARAAVDDRLDGAIQ